MGSMSRPIRVLSIIHYPVFGGPHNVTAIVAKALEPRGVETTVVIPEEGVKAAERLKGQGIDVVRMRLHRLRALRNPAVHLSYLGTMPNEVNKLRALIRQRSVDVVVLTGLHNPHGAMAARGEGAALVWGLHDTYGPRMLQRAIAPLVCRWSDVIMATGITTAAMHPGVMEFDGPLISFGPALMHDRFVHDAAVSAQARIELGLRADDLVIGTVNNINPMKGHFTFVRAAAAFRRERPARFVILGVPNHEDYMRSLLAEAARLGLQPDRDLIIRDAGMRVHELAQAFNLFWLTSEPRSEGMSTSLVEAQALGIPAIVTRTGACHECIRDGETGYLVPPHDVASIVRCSARLVDDPATLRGFSRAAETFARGAFSAVATAERHAEAYEAALERRAHRSQRTSTREGRRWHTGIRTD